MSALLDAITTEISTREDRKAILAGELDTIDTQLEQLRGMAEQAHALNGTAVTPPVPGQPSSARTTGGRSERDGRKDGNAPDGRRRPTPVAAGSASSRSSRNGSDTAGEGGGAKRAAVLAYVAANGRCKIRGIALALDMSTSAISQHLKDLRASGDVQAEGATSSRVYFTTTNGDSETAAKAKARRLHVTTQVRQRITDAIARDPGALTEQRLAQALGLDRELVADTCGQLLDDDEISLGPDATYTISRGGGGEPVDLRGRILKVLQATASTSLLSSQIAVQVSRDSHGAVSPPDVRDVCIELETAGSVTRSGGFGGQHRWAAAR